MKKIIQKLNISKKEWRFVFLLTLIIIIITTLPYLYAYFTAPKNKIYNGMHMLTPGDIYVYFSYLEQAAQGNFLFRNLFTGEVTLPVLNIFWLAAGIFGKTFNLSHIITFQLIRILLIPFCVISLYFLIAYFFNSKSIRKITLLFALFGSGFGAWAALLMPAYVNHTTLFYWPMDLWTPEHNFFLTLYHSPHIIASLTLIILIFLFFLKAVKENKYKYSILAGICGMLLIQFHPFHLPTIILVPAFYILIKWIPEFIKHRKENLIRVIKKWQDLRHFFVFSMLTAPAALYYIWLMKIDWATRLKTFQNHCYTPRFFVVLISYGALFILGTIGFFVSLKYIINKKNSGLNIQNIISDDNLLFLIVWAATQFILIFMPFRFQRRLTEGLQIPLVFLTIIGILYIKEKLKIYSLDKILFNKISATIIFILGFTLSGIFVLKIDMEYFTEKNDLFYFTNQQMQSYEFLKNEVQGNEVVLSEIMNGNVIPGVAGKKVYFGHVNVETLYYDSKLAYVNWFFRNNTNDEKKINFLKENNIKYVYYSKQEKELGSFNPEKKDYLEQIYSNDFTIIYKVKNL